MTQENRQIYDLNVRTNIHDLIYENLVEIESDIYFELLKPYYL